MPTKHVIGLMRQQGGTLATREAGAALCGVAPDELHADAIHVHHAGVPRPASYVEQPEVTCTRPRIAVPAFAESA